MNNKATVLYFPHGGGPLPLLNEPGHADLIRFLRAFPATLDKPDAIIVISAHWEATVVTITAAQSPPMLFDYQGFPAETYQYQYNAPGQPELAGRIAAMLNNAGMEAALDHQRGYDHGLFVPLMIMYPAADIPCIQVSLAASLDAAEHIRIGKAISSLKHENVLILGSGFSFHNMQAFMSHDGSQTDSRNQAFDTWLAEICSDPELSEAERESRLSNWEMAPHAAYCHPRGEHLLPLQVCYGVGCSAARTVFQGKVAGFMASAYQW